MYLNIIKKIDQVFSEFEKLSTHTKKAMQIGLYLSLVLFVIGMAVLYINRIQFNYDSYIDFIAKNIIRSSFTVYMEIIIGSLIVDFIFHKK